MSRFAVDAEQVAVVSSAVGSSITTISGEVEAMTRHLLDLQATWQGQAATSFQGVVTQWRSTQEQVRSSLEQINQALAVAGRTYADAEADAVRRFAV